MINNSKYRRSFIDIMADVIQNFAGSGTAPGPFPGPTIKIFKVTGSAGAYVLWVDDMAYAAINKTITINGNPYVITALSDNVGNHQITVNDNGSGNPGLVTFQLYSFYFYSGTPMQTADDTTGITPITGKYPMIWLLEEFKEKYYWSEGETMDRETTCKLYFLDEANPAQGVSSIRWNAFLKPIYKFRDLFMHWAKETHQDFYIWDLETNDTPKSKFGVYLSGKGVSESLFADDLAGVEVVATFAIYKNAQNLQPGSINYLN